MSGTQLPGHGDLDFTEWMARRQADAERALDAALHASTTLPNRLHEAMRYATLGGGKRVRPLLVFAAGEVTGAGEAALWKAAAAIELIHVYSLVHDDLPCMDDDVLRRGRATCHVEYDEATALLVGDALQSRAFELLADPDSGLPAAQSLALVGLLAHAAGSCGMAGGQAIDLAAVGRALTAAELELMHTLKTGALIRAAVLMGAECGTLSGEERTALDQFARRAGLLFQVVDDILDCTASTATLGKTAGKDAAQDKPTYVSLLGLAAARDFAAELHERALAALTNFGARARSLTALTEFIAHRSF